MERAALPSDPHASPPLDSVFGQTLDAGLSHLGLHLPAGARSAIESQARLLLAWGAAINLSAHRDAERIALEHVLDSLTALTHVAGRQSLLDLGSGAGYPGLPLAVAASIERVALVDSIAKKARFLEVAAAAATADCRAADGPVSHITAVRARAEALAKDDEHRAAWEVVTARAVAPLATLISLAMPLLQVGGHLVAWKRDDGIGSLARELAVARDEAAASGASHPRVDRVTVPGLEDHRIVVLDKERDVSERRSRAAGTPPPGGGIRARRC